MKKRTPIPLLASLCLFLCMLFPSLSCKRELIQPDNRDKNSLSINEAKSHFEAQFGHLSNKMATHDHNHRSGFGNEDVLEQMLANKQAIWEGAYQTLISSGKAVKIPLDIGQTFLVTDKQKQEIVPFGALNYLFMYKDSAQQIHTEWVTLFPDKDWLYGNRSEYYGIVEVKDWNGKLIRRLNHSKSPSTASSQNRNSIAGRTNNDVINTGEEDFYFLCLVWSVAEKCTCSNKNNCDMCSTCTSSSCRYYWKEKDMTPYLTPTGGPKPGTGGSGSPAGPGGGMGGPEFPDYTPPSCNPDPNYTMPTFPAPPGTFWMAPCNGPGMVPIPLGPSAELNFLNFLDLNQEQLLFINGKADAKWLFNQYLIANGVDDDTKEFVEWGINYLMEHPGMSTVEFNITFLPSIQITPDDSFEEANDPENEYYNDPHPVAYLPYQDFQQWPDIPQVIRFQDFVPIRYKKDNPNEVVDCLTLAKEQLAKKGYVSSAFIEGSPQIIQAYTEKDGVNLVNTRKTITYLLDALGKGIPVVAGVDLKPKSVNKDKTSDHFIVIVGAGSDAKGKYFQFMDSSTNWPTLGASKKNRLYFDAVSGKITGKTMSQYGSRAGYHDFILAHVRKSIEK